MSRFPALISAARRLLLGLALFGATLPLAVAAPPDGLALLQQWLHDTHGAQAEFTQSVATDRGGAPQVSSGSFSFERPGRFRWVYLKPYRQDIVSDGSTIWTYDHDLDQVTISTQTQALGNTPAALLAGADVQRVFRLQALPEQGGLQWVQATPRSADSSFVWVRLGLRQGAQGPQLEQMVLRDAFRRTSTIVFSAQHVNPRFPSGTFEFTPPLGAAVISPGGA
ncbi:outer membrane lipoprotein chaperone LolA [Thiomonas sp.]|jgi:outer membrane lipoprotein carrier protein|uniref:outer membrane lipoprotein chaperone LolA n=1 Tax=Thiomonas sp. TaxID=2047785 RepID=UPI002613D4CD|nr:outer membrane lipoprotein chaperone LolA [Thiomonas sp.]